MKAILEFDLPEDKEEYEMCAHGVDWMCIVNEIDNWLRNKSKYEDKDTVKIEDVRQKIHEEMAGRMVEF